MSLRYLAALALLLFSGLAVAADNPFLGRWALTIPGGGAGWLGIEEKDGALKGSILWGGGSVLPVQTVKADGNTLDGDTGFQSEECRDRQQRRGHGNDYRDRLRR